MPEPGSFYLFTQGCKINQYESQSIREAWRSLGWREVSHPGQADVVLINSCAVTQRAVQDLRKALRRLGRECPQARFAVTGCAIPGYSGELQDMSGVQALVPQKEKSRLLQGPQVVLSGTWEQGRCNGLSVWDFGISGFFRARPVLKVQDGCSMGCTYCYVPLSRGPSRSRAPDQVLGESLELVRSGYRELVISGINLGDYRASRSGMRDFWDLILWLQERLVQEGAERARLRLSSLDPSLLSDKGLQVLSSSPLLCPHLHLSLQSASPKVLQAMGRSHYRLEEIKSFISALGDIWPGYALGADFLLGFPGESEADFEQTLAFCRDMPFTYGHVFTFSPRPGTQASNFGERVPEKVKKQRSRRLRHILQGKREVFLRRTAAQRRLEISLEQLDPPAGLCQHYIFCYLEGGTGSRQKGDLVSVEPLRVQNGAILARIPEGKL